MMGPAKYSRPYILSYVSYEAGFYKPTIFKAHPNELCITNSLHVKGFVPTTKVLSKKLKGVLKSLFQDVQ
jgi:hypothetical protein